ncbi:MAG: nucleoside deaminase [Bacteroidota bacterium]
MPELTEADHDFMRMAMAQARMAFDAGEIPVGAIITDGKRIIARAHNLCEQLNDVTAHAEMLALTSAASYLGGKYLTECTLYVTTEPCPMCAGALGWAQVKRIVFGCEDLKRGYRKFSPDIIHPKTELVSGLMSDESSALMKSFFAGLRE